MANLPYSPKAHKESCFFFSAQTRHHYLIGPHKHLLAWANFFFFGGGGWHSNELGATPQFFVFCEPWTLSPIIDIFEFSWVEPPPNPCPHSSI